jgi:hypothetical protein
MTFLDDKTILNYLLTFKTTGSILRPEERSLKTKRGTNMDKTNEELKFENDLLKKALAMSDKKIEITLGQYKALERNCEALIRYSRLALEVLERWFNDGYVQQGLRAALKQAEGV